MYQTLIIYKYLAKIIIQAILQLPQFKTPLESTRPLDSQIPPDNAIHAKSLPSHQIDHNIPPEMVFHTNLEWLWGSTKSIPNLQWHFIRNLPSLKLTVRPWKWMVGRWNFLLGRHISSGKLLVSGRVSVYLYALTLLCQQPFSPACSGPTKRGRRKACLGYFLRWKELGPSLKPTQRVETPEMFNGWVGWKMTDFLLGCF